MLSKPSSDPQDCLLYSTVMATPTITFWWGWEEQFWGPADKAGAGSHAHLQCPGTVGPPGMLRGLCISRQHLPAQHLTPRRSSCLAGNLVTPQMTRFRLAGRQLLKRFYVGMAVNELITIGSSVFIFASICMIHELLTFLLLEKSVQ